MIDCFAQAVMLYYGPIVHASASSIIHHLVIGTIFLAVGDRIVTVFAL
jgi:hypothetical protein